MRYHIMSGDREVAAVDEQVHILDQRLAPQFLKRTGNFVSWVEQRAIDGTRTNARMLKKAQGLSSFSPAFETAMKYHAACITDNFWVRPEGEEELTYDQIRFRDDLYFRMAVSSDDSAFSLKPSKSPELTNIGSREKGWRRLGDEWWLYKKDEFPEHELLTCEVGILMGFDMARYEMDHGLIRTKDFTGGQVNLQHMDSWIGDEEAFAANYHLIRELAPGQEQRFLDILCLDVIMNNPDRHTKNYGFLTSQTDGRILCLAPNYDNDMALYGIRQDWFTYQVNNRIMQDFLSFLQQEKLSYRIPPLDPDGIRELCRRLPEGGRTAEYILNRHAFLRERFNKN